MQLLRHVPMDAWSGKAVWRNRTLSVPAICGHRANIRPFAHRRAALWILIVTQQECSETERYQESTGKTGRKPAEATSAGIVRVMVLRESSGHVLVI